MDIFKVILAASIAGSYVYFMFFYLTSMTGSNRSKVAKVKQMSSPAPIISPANNIPIVVRMPSRKVLARDDIEWGDTLEVPSYLRQEQRVRPPMVKSEAKPPIAKKRRKKTPKTSIEQPSSVSGSSHVSAIDDMAQLELINNGSFELIE